MPHESFPSHSGRLVDRRPCRRGPTADEPKWKQHTINGRSEFEAAGVFDVDNDGQLDIVSGDTWYQGPTWKPYHVREVTRQGTYYNDFATLPLDVNGDGQTDFVTCSYFGKDVGWVENPGKAGVAVDLSRDRSRRGISRPPGWSTSPGTASLTSCPTPSTWSSGMRSSSRPDGKGLELKKHDFGTDGGRSRRGLGRRQRRRPGRLAHSQRAGSRPRPIPRTEPGPGTPNGSSARRASRSSRATWTATASPTSSTAWATITGSSGFIRGRNSGGERTWTKQTIDQSIASVHTLLWADIDGDGKAHELVTGKRVYAHEIEPGATDGSVIAWYRFDPHSKRWVKHVIFQGEPAKNAPAKGGDRLALRDFPPGTAGTGLQMTAIDIDQRW